MQNFRVSGYRSKYRYRENDFGWWCESDNVTQVKQQIELIHNDGTRSLGIIGNIYLNRNYNSDVSYNKIIDF